MVQKQYAFRNKKKNKQENKQGTNPKPKQTTTFKKKKVDGGCFVCGSDDHWASACPDCKFKREEKKSVNMVNYSYLAFAILNESKSILLF